MMTSKNINKTDNILEDDVVLENISTNKKDRDEKYAKEIEAIKRKLCKQYYENNVNLNLSLNNEFTRDRLLINKIKKARLNNEYLTINELKEKLLLKKDFDSKSLDNNSSPNT